MDLCEKIVLNMKRAGKADSIRADGPFFGHICTKAVNFLLHYLAMYLD